MMELGKLIKDCVSSVCKSGPMIYILIMGDTLIVDAMDTSLGVINLGFDTQMTYCNQYKADTIDEDLAKGAVYPETMNKILGYWKQYEELSAVTQEIARCDDLRSNEDFEKLMTLKADQGLKWLKLPCYELYKHCYVPIFSGFPNLNKADKAGIVVKRIDRNTLLMEYHIYKKKINRDVLLWVRTLDMDKSILDHKYEEWENM